MGAGDHSRGASEPPPGGDSPAREAAAGGSAGAAAAYGRAVTGAGCDCRYGRPRPGPDGAGTGWRVVTSAAPITRKRLQVRPAASAPRVRASRFGATWRSGQTPRRGRGRDERAPGAGTPAQAGSPLPDASRRAWSARRVGASRSSLERSQDQAAGRGPHSCFHQALEELVDLCPQAGQLARNPGRTTAPLVSGRRVRAFWERTAAPPVPGELPEVTGRPPQPAGSQPRPPAQAAPRRAPDRRIGARSAQERPRSGTGGSAASGGVTSGGVTAASEVLNSWDAS